MEQMPWFKAQSCDGNDWVMGSLIRHEQYCYIFPYDKSMDYQNLEAAITLSSRLVYRESIRPITQKEFDMTLKAEELVKAHIRSGHTLPYFDEVETPQQNCLNFIEYYYQTFKEDMPNVRFTDAAQWMHDHTSEVVEVFDRLWKQRADL